MTEETPIACSLGANDLQQRLAAIAALGTENLVEHSVDGNRHLLRFRADPGARRRLEEIVAAEAECCSFLDLGLAEQGGDLVLSISAPNEARQVADRLASAFAGASA